MLSGSVLQSYGLTSALHSWELSYLSTDRHISFCHWDLLHKQGMLPCMLLFHKLPCTLPSQQCCLLPIRFARWSTIPRFFHQMHQEGNCKRIKLALLKEKAAYEVSVHKHSLKIRHEHLPECGLNDDPHIAYESYKHCIYSTV